MSFYRVIAKLPLITLKLWSQSERVTTLMARVRYAWEDEARTMGAFRFAVLVVRLAMAVVVLHSPEILHWAGFYSLRRLPSWTRRSTFPQKAFHPLGAVTSTSHRAGALWCLFESVFGVLNCGLSVSFCLRLSRGSLTARSNPKEQCAGVIRRSFAHRNI
jgi:hypothetical protein